MGQEIFLERSADGEMKPTSLMSGDKIFIEILTGCCLVQISRRISALVWASPDHGNDDKYPLNLQLNGIAALDLAMLLSNCFQLSVVRLPSLENSRNVRRFLVK
ncbi:MAG: hypothetical protein AAB386_02120 [Patescibacteria group bacterium]